MFKSGNAEKHSLIDAGIVSQNISLYCDCGVGAPPPQIRDIGILASLDPVAIDKACYDLINNENTTGSQTWIQRANNKLALHTLEVAEDHGIGTMEYNLINVDEDEPETDTTEPGKDTDTTEPGKDTDTTEPGQDTDTTEPQCKLPKLHPQLPSQPHSAKSPMSSCSMNSIFCGLNISRKPCSTEVL